MGFVVERTEELAMNVIVEARYTQYDLDENKYVYLIPSWITGRIPMWPCLVPIRSRSFMERRFFQVHTWMGTVL